MKIDNMNVRSQNGKEQELDYEFNKQKLKLIETRTGRKIRL